MQLEPNAIEKTRTYKILDLPLGVKPNDCCWIHKIKYLNDGSIVKFKVD